MGGRLLAEKLLSARPDLRVLYMSGYAEDAVLPLARAPRTRFRTKPFPASELLADVVALLEAD